MYIACLISCDKLVRTCMELILFHFLYFSNTFNVFYAISPAPLCREEIPQQAFVFGECKHFKKVKNQNHGPVYQLWIRPSLVCSSARQPPSEVNQRQVVLALSAQSSTRYVLFRQHHPRAFPGNPRTSRKRGQSKGRILYYIGQRRRELEISYCLDLHHDAARQHTIRILTYRLRG